MMKIVHYSCDHKNIEDCDCLTDENKLDFIFRIHKAKTCMQKNHKQMNHLFQDKSYYVVDRPTWASVCETPFLPKDPFLKTAKQILEICQIECDCTTEFVCILCKCMHEMSDHLTSEASDTTKMVIFLTALRRIVLLQKMKTKETSEQRKMIVDSHCAMCS